MIDFDTLPKITHENVEEKISAFFARTAGKIIVVTDAAAFPAVKNCTAAPRAVTLVLDSFDLLPLFTVSEGAGGVLAAGSPAVLRLGRAFAALSRLPCLILPTDAALDGVFSREEELLADGKKRTFRLAEGECVLDMRMLAPTLGEAYARLLLARLAVFEARALEKLLKIPYPAACERAFGLLQRPFYSAQEIVEINSVLRVLEEEGLPKGEGVVLKDSLACVSSALSSYVVLRALYSAFFSKGMPRHILPAYRARAEAAGVPYEKICIPTPEELARRSAAFFLMRGAATAELAFIKRAEGAHLREIARYTKAEPQDALPAAKLLPERTQGLVSVMRDFGLLEEL